MTNFSTSKTLIMSVSALALISCGGGGSSSDSTSSVAVTPPTPVSSSGFVSGPIDGFGSIIVNGERYETDGASFIINDEAGSQDDLRVGQIVTLQTSMDNNGNRRADRVEYDSELEGPITSINLEDNSFVALGQTVFILGTTSFDDDISPASIEGLAVGDFVEVSGNLDSSGNLIASQIEIEDDGDEEFELTGVVSNLNAGAMTFQIGNLVIDFSTAELEGFEGVAVAYGDLVEVEGTAFNGEILIADEVENEDDDLDVDDEDEGEIFGTITAFVSPANFTVGTIVVDASNAEFEECRASDLGLDLQVEVEGEFNANGVLIAEEVECESESEFEIEGFVEAVDAEAGTLTVLGITIFANQSTRFDDRSESDDDMFNFAAIQVGDFVEVTGFERADMTIFASNIELEDDDDEDGDEFDIEGPVEFIGTNSLVILGVTIETNAETEFEGDDDNDDQGDDDDQGGDDGNLSAEAFFAQLMIGDIVEAEGIILEDGTFLATELEIDD